MIHHIKKESNTAPKLTEATNNQQTNLRNHCKQLEYLCLP